MQETIGKRGHSQGHQRITIALTGLFTLIFSSCTIFEKIPQGADSYELLRPFCLNGEGKGRLKVDQTRNVFSYKSFFSEQDLFTMIVDIPLHGEESIVINLKTQKISGSFIKYKKEMEQLQSFFQQFFPFLSYLKSLEQHHAKDCTATHRTALEESFQCHTMDIKTTTQNIQFFLKNQEKLKIRITARALQVFYRKIKWEVLSPEYTWSLELFPTECEENLNGTKMI